MRGMRTIAVYEPQEHLRLTQTNAYAQPTGKASPACVRGHHGSCYKLSCGCECHKETGDGAETELR